MNLSRRHFLAAAGASLAFSAGCARTPVPSHPPGGESTLQVPDALVEHWVQSVLNYCADGEPVLLGLKENRVVALKGIPESPVNFGKLCVKGLTWPKVVGAQDRAQYPRIRKIVASKGNEAGAEQAKWNDAMELVASKVKEIVAQNGPDSLAFIVSGQLATEAHYVLNKLVKGAVGTNNLDSTSRISSAPAVAGYEAGFGTDGPPGCIEDADVAECIFIAGSNMAETHPALFYRVADNKLKNGIKVIVLDPRKSPTCVLADIHLQPRRLGTDTAILNAICHVLIKENLYNKEFVQSHVSGFSELREFLFGRAGARLRFGNDEHFFAPVAYTSGYAAMVSGLPASQIEEAARAIGKARATTTFWSSGLGHSSHGALSAMAVNNIHLLTGNVGKEGGSPWALPGQANDLGARMAGSFPNLLPCGRKVSNPADRDEIAHFWGVPKENLKSEPGLSMTDLATSIKEGKIKGLFIIGANPAVSMAQASELQAALKTPGLFTVLVDCFYPTETAIYADVVLPAALPCGEGEGVFVNIERRVQLAERATNPQGEALPDWKILVDLAKRLGHENHFPYVSSSEIWDEFRKVSTGTHCDVSGISYDRLRRGNKKDYLGIQWPCAGEKAEGTKRRYKDGLFTKAAGRPLTPGSKARLHKTPYKAPEELPGAEYPLYLTTGRCLEHFNTRTRTGKVNDIHFAVPRAWLEIHPDDAGKRGIKDGDYVWVQSARGKFKVKAWLTDRVSAGLLFVPFHFGPLSDLEGGTNKRGEGDSTANQATQGAPDPISGQPELKCCAVRISKAPGE